MARKARKISESKLYFIHFEALHGIKLFYSKADCDIFFDCLKLYKEKYACDIIAYSVNAAEVHILLKDNTERLSDFMRSLLSAYVLKYNRKYNRSGAITAKRFTSVPVGDGYECVNAAVFIHQLETDYFSSKSEYFENADGICNKGWLLEYITLNEFASKHSKKPDFCFSSSRMREVTDEKALKIIMEYTSQSSPEGIGGLSKHERDKILSLLRTDAGISIRTLERLTGISRGIISRACNKNSEGSASSYKTRNDITVKKITEKKEEAVWLL